MKKLTLPLLIALSLSLSSCGGLPATPTPEEMARRSMEQNQRYNAEIEKIAKEQGLGDPVGNEKLLGARVVRIIDDEAGVVCWYMPSSGIDCMPISETNLKR